MSEYSVLKNINIQTILRIIGPNTMSLILKKKINTNLWTSADLPEDSDPTIPKRRSGTALERVHSWELTNESENKSILIT